jgi:hypothetical protein
VELRGTRQASLRHVRVEFGAVYVTYVKYLILAQSFCPFLARDGRQVRCPSWIWATSLCYILLNKFVALVGSGRQVYVIFY